MSKLVNLVAIEMPKEKFIKQFLMTLRVSSRAPKFEKRSFYCDFLKLKQKPYTLSNQFIFSSSVIYMLYTNIKKYSSFYDFHTYIKTWAYSPTELCISYIYTLANISRQFDISYINIKTVRNILHSYSGFYTWTVRHFIHPFFGIYRSTGRQIIHPYADIYIIYVIPLQLDISYIHTQAYTHTKT